MALLDCEEARLAAPDLIACNKKTTQTQLEISNHDMRKKNRVLPRPSKLDPQLLPLAAFIAHSPSVACKYKHNTRMRVDKLIRIETHT